MTNFIKLTEFGRERVSFVNVAAIATVQARNNKTGSLIQLLVTEGSTEDGFTPEHLYAKESPEQIMEMVLEVGQ